MVEKVRLSVIIPTHTGHKRFIKSCIEHVRALGADEITILYDNMIKLSKHEVDVETYLPPADVCNMVDSILLIKRDRLGGSVGSKWCNQQRDAMGLIYARGADLVLTINGDCVITKPKGFNNLVKEFIKDDYDIAPCHSVKNNYGTIAFLTTGKAYVDVMTNMRDTLFDKRQNAEGRLATSADNVGLKCLDGGEKVYGQFSKPHVPTKNRWLTELGLYHLHGIEKHRQANKIPPLKKKYYDTRFLRIHEKAALEPYWKDGNPEHLYLFKYWRRKND